VNNETLLHIGGVIQLGILTASALVPGTLDWRTELGKLSALSRQLIWVHGGYVVLTITSMGLLSLFEASQLAEGSVLARTVCAFVAIFWSVRLIIQWALFDARPYLANWPLRLGYHGLTLAFACLTAIYGWLAIR
jgi:hypothetical protein